MLAAGAVVAGARESQRGGGIGGAVSEASGGGGVEEGEDPRLGASGAEYSKHG